MSVANNSKFRDTSNQSNVAGWSHGNQTPLNSRVNQKFAQTSTDKSPRFLDMNSSPFNQYQIQQKDLNSRNQILTAKRSLENQDSEAIFQSYEQDMRRTTGAFPMRSYKSRSPTSNRDMQSVLKPQLAQGIDQTSGYYQENSEFQSGVQELARNQKMAIEQQQYEEQHPEAKFNQKILGILQSKHVARRRSPITGMGGGGVGNTNSTFVAVVPKKTHYLNEDLYLKSTQRAKSLQKNTVTQRASKQHRIANTTETYQQQKAFNAFVIDHFEKREEENASKNFVKQVNSHYEWLETAIQSDSVENQRIKRKIMEFSASKKLLLVISKLWFALLHLNYGRQDIKKNASNIISIPLNKGVYKIAFQLIIKALKNSIYSTDEYLVSNDQNYKKTHVFFERFRYDVCSLVSEHIDSGMIQPDTFEVILRQVYKRITFFRQKDKIQIRQFGDVGPVPLDSQQLVALAPSPLRSANTSGLLREDDSFERHLHNIRQGTNETELDFGRDRGQQLQSLQNSLNDSYESQIQSPRSGLIENSGTMGPLKLDGFKLEKIDDVLALPDNQEHILSIKRNAETFNPNHQQVIYKNTDERREAHFNPPECKKNHNTGMNYHVQANRTAGQRERIETSDKIVDLMRWKQQTKRTRTKDTGTGFQTSFGVQTPLYLEEYALKASGPQGAQALRFDPIRHKNVIKEDVQMPGGDPKNQFVRGGVSLQPPSHQKSSKSTYDKLMYGVYKGTKADPRQNQFKEGTADASDYRLSQEKGFNNGTGGLEQTFEAEEEIQIERTVLETKTKGKNSGADSLADDASQTEQERNMSPTAGDDRTNVVAEEYLEGEKVLEGEIMHVQEPLNDSGQEEQLSKQQQESAFQMKAGGQPDSSQKLPTDVAGSLQDTNPAGEQQIDVPAFAEDQDQSRNMTQHLARGSVPTNLDEGAQDGSTMRQNERFKQGQSEAPQKLGLDGQSLGSKDSREMSLGSVKERVDTSGPQTARQTFQEDVETVRNTKTAACASNRDPTASVDDPKRKQVYSRVSERELDVFQNQLAKNKHPGRDDQDGRTESQESHEGPHRQVASEEQFGPAKSQPRAPVFSKSFLKDATGQGDSITPVLQQQHLRQYGDDKMSMDTGFDIGLGERITTRDEDPNFKLVVSARRDPKQALHADTPAQAKLTEQRMMEKYKKFEKLNLMSRMICEQLPGVDGYKLQQSFLEPLEPTSAGIILDLGIQQDRNDVLAINRPAPELSIGFIPKHRNATKKQSSPQRQSPHSRNVTGQPRLQSKKTESKDQKSGTHRPMGSTGQEMEAEINQEVDLASGNPLFAQIGDALLAQVKLSMDGYNEAGHGKTDPNTQSPFHSGTPSPSARLPRPSRQATSNNLILVTENGQFQDAGQANTRRLSNNFNQAANQVRTTTESTVSRSRKPQGAALSPITAISTQRGAQESYSPISPLAMPRQKQSYIRQGSLDHSSAYSNQQSPGAMRHTNEPGTINRRDFAEISHSRDGSQERQLRPELGLKVVPQRRENADLGEASEHNGRTTLESPATRLTKTPELCHYDNDQDDRDRTVQLADTLYSTLKKQSPETLKGNQNLKHGIQLQKQQLTSFGNQGSYDDPLDQIIDQRENVKSPSEQIQELQSLMMDNRNSGKHMDQRVFGKNQSNQGSSPKTRGSKTVSPGQHKNKPEIAVEIGKKQQRAELEKVQNEVLSSSRPRNARAEERFTRKIGEAPKIERAASKAPVVDTRLLFQRKTIQNMKTQNREIVKRQRKEQDELKRISQYEKVQKQYLQSEQSKERMRQSSNGRNADTYTNITPLVQSKPGSKDGTGTILDESAISAISYVPNQEGHMAQARNVKTPYGITKHSTIHPMKSRSTKASKSMSKDEHIEPSDEAANMVQQEATRQEQQTSPMDRHLSQREYIEFTQNSRAPGSPKMEPHSSLKVDNSFRNSIQTMQSGALDQKYIRTRNDQFLGDARDRSNSPPWNAVNQGQGAFKGTLDAQSSDRGPSRLEATVPELSAVGLSDYLSYRKLEPNPAALNQGYHGQKARKNGRDFRDFTESSSGVDQDLIADFLKLNESLINQHISNGAQYPSGSEEDKEHVQGLMQQIRFFQEQLIKSSQEFAQGGLPGQLPVVIPQPLSSNLPTNNSLSYADDSKEFSQALGKELGSKASKKSTDSPYLTDAIVLGPAGLTDPGQLQAEARLKMPSPTDASELVGQFQYLQSLYIQRKQALVLSRRESKLYPREASGERSVQSINASAEQFGPEGESYRQKSRVQQNSKRSPPRHRQIKLSSMKTPGGGDTGDQDEVGSPGSPALGPAIIRSQYEHDPSAIVSRKQSMPIQEPYPAYQHATERNQTIKLSPRMTSRKDMDTFAPSPKPDVQSTKKVSQQQLLNTDLSMVSHSMYGDVGTAEKRARKRRSGLHESLSKQSTKRDVMKEGSKQSTTRKNMHPFKDPKVITEANSEGKEDSQPEVLGSDQQEGLDKGDLNNRSSSNSDAAAGAKQAALTAEPSLTEAAKAQEIAVNGIEVIPERGSDVHSEHPQSRVISANLHNQNQTFQTHHQDNTSTKNVSAERVLNSKSGRSPVRLSRSQKRTNEDLVDFHKVDSKTDISASRPHQYKSKSSSNSRDISSSRETNQKEYLDKIQVGDTILQLQNLGENHIQSNLAMTSANHSSQGGLIIEAQLMQPNYSHLRQKDTNPIHEITANQKEGDSSRFVRERKGGADRRAPLNRISIKPLYLDKFHMNQKQSEMLPLSGGKKIKTTIPHRRNQRVPDLVSPGFGPEAPHTPTLGGGRGAEDEHSTPFNIETVQSGNTGMSYSVGPAHNPKNTAPSHFSPGVRQAGGDTSGRSSAASKSLNSPHSELKNRREADHLLGNALMVETHQNLNEMGPATEAQFGPDDLSENELDPTTVQPISPIGYNVSINMQYRSLGPLPDPGKKNQKKQQDQEGYAASRRRKKKPILMPQFEIEGGEPINRNFLALLGKDTGKELFEKYQEKIKQEQKAKEALEARRFSKRRTSGFNNELIQFAEQQQALGLSPKTTNLEDATQGSRGPVAFISTGEDSKQAGKSLDKKSLMRNFVSGRQNLSQTTKLVTIPNERLPNGNISKRYWQFNKQMSPRVLPGQAQMAQVAFGAKPTLPKLGDDQKYKTICGSFRQKSNSVSITQKLKAIDALIKEERAGGRSSRQNSQVQSREYSEQYLYSQQRNAEEQKARESGNFSSRKASENFATRGWKGGHTSDVVIPSIHDSRRASAHMGNWNNEAHFNANKSNMNQLQQSGNSHRSESSSKNIVITLQANARMPSINKVSNQNFGFSTVTRGKIHGSGSGMPQQLYDARMASHLSSEAYMNPSLEALQGLRQPKWGVEPLNTNGSGPRSISPSVSLPESGAIRTPAGETALGTVFGNEMSKQSMVAPLPKMIQIGSQMRTPVTTRTPVKLTTLPLREAGHPPPPTKAQSDRDVFNLHQMRNERFKVTEISVSNSDQLSQVQSVPEAPNQAHSSSIGPREPSFGRPTPGEFTPNKDVSSMKGRNQTLVSRASDNEPNSALYIATKSDAAETPNSQL